MGVLADWQIEAEKIVSPFEPGRSTPNMITFGCGSYGYDLRVGREFQIFSPIKGAQLGADGVIDPKNFDPRFLERVEADVCVIPPHTYALGVSMEHVTVPRSCVAIIIGKSTYARSGLVVNCTPLEPEWQGHVTLEFANTAPLPLRIYAGEGIAQMIFLRADAARINVWNGGGDALLSDSLCITSYADKKGRYQNQGAAVTLACATGREARHADPAPLAAGGSCRGGG